MIQLGWRLVGMGAVLLALGLGDAGLAAAQSAEGSGPAAPAEGSGDPSAARQAAIDRGRVEHEAGRTEAAWTIFDAHLAARPDDLEAAVAFSRALSAQGNFDAAMAYLRHHLSVYPRSHTAALELSGLLVTLLEFDEAIPYLEGIPADAGVAYSLGQLNLGKAYRAVGRLVEARALYTRLLSTGSRTFAEAALCEIDLAEGQLEACRQRLEAARTALGDSPVLAQPAVFLDYLSGDLDAAERRLTAVAALGDLGSRLRTMFVLLPLARGQVADAQGALTRLDQVTVRGERDALTALIQSAAGRPDLAVTAWRAAGQRNSLFADPARAGQVLLWRPEAVAALSRALDPTQPAGASGPAEATGTGTGEPALPVTPAAPPESGCCRTGAGPSPSPLWLLLVPAALGLRRRACV